MTQSIGTLPKEYYTLLNLQLLENPVPLKKTLDFYGVIDDNAWNRPATASKKIFEFYHKDNQSKAHLIQSLKDQQIAHTKKLNHQKKVKILGAKYEDKTRLETRTLETNRLQFSSNQRLNIWEDNEEKMNRITVDDLEIKKMLAKKGIKIINRELLYNEWNNFTHMPKKTVEILANDKILNLDEKAIKFIGKKMNDEKNTQKFKRQINLMKREKELDSLRNNHLKTYMSEKKIYGHLFRPNLNNDTNKNFPYKYCNKDKMAAFLNKNLVKNELFERLSIPKDVEII